MGALGVLKYQLMSRCDQFDSPSLGSLPSQVLVLNENTPTDLMKYPRETSRWYRWDMGMLESHFQTVVKKYDDSDDEELVACGKVADVSMSLSECEAANRVTNVSITRTYEYGEWSKTYRIQAVVWSGLSESPVLLAEWEKLSVRFRGKWAMFMLFTTSRAAHCSTNGQTAEEWLIDLTRE